MIDQEDKSDSFEDVIKTSGWMNLEKPVTNITSNITSACDTAPENQEQVEMNRMFKTTIPLPLMGALANTTRVNIYWKINKELEMYNNVDKNAHIFSYLMTKFNLSRQDDRAVMTLIQGYNAAYYITNNLQQSVRHCKELVPQIYKYNLKNPHIV